MRVDPAPAPWWWLTRHECLALGLGDGVQRTADGFAFGDAGAPCRLEIVARDERAPVKLGSVSIRVWGELEAARVRTILGAAVRTLHARRGHGFDPGAVRLESEASVPLRSPPGLIPVPSLCDRACVFCGRSITPVAMRGTHGRDEDVERAIDNATGDVLFTGDNALGHPRIAEFIARIASRKKGGVGLIGPAGADLGDARAAQLAGAGLSAFQSGLFGGEARTHDALAGRVGAFAALAAAVPALRARGVRVELVTPLIRPLLGDLAQIIGCARSLTGAAPALLAYVPDPDVGTAFDAMVPAFDELRAALVALGPDFPGVDALPLCALPPSRRAIGPVRLERSGLGAPSYPDPPCGLCVARDRCPGVAGTVLRATGGRGLVALPAGLT